MRPRVLAISLLLLAPALGAAQETATFRGFVGTYSFDDWPLGGIRVTLLNQHGQVARQINTAEDGSWTLLVQTGDSPVRIQFWDPRGWYETEWYEEAADAQGARSLSFARGEAIDIYAQLRLKPGAKATLRGKVTDEAGNPLPGIRVAVDAATMAHWDVLAGARCSGLGPDRGGEGGCDTDKNGEFVADVVTRDPVTLRFFDDAGDYTPEYYSDAPTQEGAQPLSPDPGETMEIEASLAAVPRGPGAPATIQGTVTDEAGNPVFEGNVVVVMNAACETIAHVDTDQAGRYVAEIGPLTDRVKLYFQSWWHEPEWHPDADDCATARTLALKPGATLEVDASLVTHAVIAGTVTDESGGPLHGAEVVIQPSGRLSGVFFPTDEKGKFAIPVHASDMPVTVRFSGHLIYPAYEAEWYDDVPSQMPFHAETAPDEARRLSPNRGETIDLQVALALASTDDRREATVTIEGTVTDEAGNPLVAQLILFRADGPCADDDVEHPGRPLYTDEAGHYTVEVDTKYREVKVHFRELTREYQAEFHENAYDCASARGVHLKTPGQTIRVDASLDPAPRITGTVTGEDGEPLSGINVTASTRLGGSGVHGQTDHQGRYVVRPQLGLMPVNLRFWPSQAGNDDDTYLEEWYEDASSREGARLLSLMPGETIEIDVTLARAAAPAADAGPGGDPEAGDPVAAGGGGGAGGGRGGAGTGSSGADGGTGGGGAERRGGGRAGTGAGRGGAADGMATGAPADEEDPAVAVTRQRCGDTVCPPDWRCEGERCLEPPDGGDPDLNTPIRPPTRQPRPPAPARPPTAIPPPDGRSWGDVHLRTFDGAAYDFQAAGEFVGARSLADDLEVQLRMQPLGNNDRVSVTTGVAVRIAGDRVSIVVDRPPTLRVNGEQVRLERATQHELAGGGRIVTGDNLHVLVWPDESTLTVELYGTSMNAYLTPAPSRRGTLVGLFGNFDGESDNDFVTADGERLEPPLGFESIYGKLGASWRIGQREALFDYEPGQSTESFTIPGFPARSATVADLSAADRRRAEQVCRQAGITDPAILEACIVDVGHSGDEGFALAAASTQVREGVPLAGAGRAASATLGPEPIVSGLCRPATAAAAAASYRADGGRTARYPDALRRLRGEQRWSAQGFRPGHDPLAVDDRVLAARERGLAALDAETGQIVWEVASAGGRIAGPGLLAAGGAVFAAWTDELAAYDLEAGTECWRLPVGPATSPAFADGRLFISVPEGGSGYAAAVDAATGRILWRHDGRHPSPANWPNPSAPTVGGGAVFVADGPEVVALYPASGEPRWRATTGGLVSASLAYADGVLYVPTRNRGLHALDAATGNPLWVWRDPGAGNLHASLALSDDLVFVVDERHLHAIDRDSGAESWRAEGERLNLFHAPVLAGDRLYAITQAGALVVFDARRGAELHRIRASERPAYGPATPTPGDRLLYFVLPDSKLYALR